MGQSTVPSYPNLGAQRLTFLVILQDNHKPSYTANTRKATITQPTQATNIYNLSMIDTDEDNQTSIFMYTGEQKNASSGSYVLIFDPVKQSFNLETLDSEFNFNLTSAPWEADEQTLAENYPQLEFGYESPSERDEDLFEDGGIDDAPDPSNPYDYRHFMNDRPWSPSSESAPTPKVTATTKATTIAPRIQQRDTPKPKPKPKPRTRVAPQTRRPSPPPKVPARVEHVDASEGDEADASSDDGSLIIELEEPETTTIRPHHNVLSNTLSASRGPVSLRSAASSISPASQRARSSSSSSDASDVDNHSRNDHVRSKPSVDDEDVDILALPSPAVVQTPGEPDEEEEGHDEELERELAQALENDEGDEEEYVGEPMVVTSSQQRAVESESESEEE
ncbi:MAG: hypothetical protein M1835_006503 [Candelina submexicana]|nr:MAG: hypothetical protein M1835_006503 [Candelina submexicana]